MKPSEHFTKHCSVAIPWEALESETDSGNSLKILFNSPVTTSANSRGLIHAVKWKAKTLALIGFTFANIMKNVNNVRSEMRPRDATGFTEADGCFYVNISRNEASKSGFRIRGEIPTFYITQDSKSKHLARSAYMNPSQRALRARHHVKQVHLLRSEGVHFQRKVPL